MIPAAIGFALCLGSWGEGTLARASIDPLPESARARMVAELHDAVERVSAVEVALAGIGVQEFPDDARDELDALRSRMRALMDTVAFRTERGAEEISELRRRYPHSALLLELEACLLERAGDPEGAAARYERLLESRPRDAGLHLAWARNRLALADTASALAGFSRALDLEPEANEPFRALVGLHEQQGTLELLLTRVERLTVLYPESPVLESRVRELLHRMRGPRARLNEQGAEQ